MTIRPLTHRNTDGELYRRLPAVEDQIGEALGLEPDTLIDRARVQDSSDARYLGEECLVYLIREARRDGNGLLVNDLSGVLVDRCAIFLAAKLRKLGPDTAAEASADVITQLFGKILDLDGDAGDFFQVRFWFGLRALTTSVFGRYLKQLQRTRELLPLSALAGQETEQNDSDDDARTTATSTDYRDAAPMPEQLALCQEALEQLPDRIREAYVLRYYAHWPITSTDPMVPTLSEWFGVTPRAIGKWFEKAEAILENWRGA